MHEDEHAHADGLHEPAAHAPALDLGDEERLPWLESADDIETEPHGGNWNQTSQ